MPLEDICTDVNALLPGRSTEAGARRRTVLQSAVGLGYAAAAAPLMAQTAVATPADGLDARLPGSAHRQDPFARGAGGAGNFWCA